MRCRSARMGKRWRPGSRDRTVKLWDVITQQELTTFVHADEVTAVAFSPDGKTLAVGSNDGSVRFVRAATEEQVLAQSRK